MSNLNPVDNIDGTAANCQLAAGRLSKVVVHDCWVGPCAVELTPNRQAPVYRLPTVEMLDGLRWRADVALIEGPSPPRHNLHAREDSAWASMPGCSR
jgi:acetoacetate decarboxylase